MTLFGPGRRHCNIVLQPLLVRFRASWRSQQLHRLPIRQAWKEALDEVASDIDNVVMKPVKSRLLTVAREKSYFVPIGRVAPVCFDSSPDELAVVMQPSA